MISYKYKKMVLIGRKNMFKQLIAGELVEGDGKPLEVINPTTGKVLEVIPTATEEQTQKALESAQKAFESWSKKSIAGKGIWKDVNAFAYRINFINACSGRCIIECPSSSFSCCIGNETNEDNWSRNG
jgi:hypothetical protein